MVEQRNINNFITDESFVEQSIKRLPATLDIDSFIVELTTNQRIGEAVLDDYICSICTNIVW